MTEEVIQTRKEKTRWLHRRYFHFASEAAFLQNQEVLMKLFMIFRSQVSQGNPGDHNHTTLHHSHRPTQSTPPEALSASGNSGCSEREDQQNKSHVPTVIKFLSEIVWKLQQMSHSVEAAYCQITEKAPARTNQHPTE